MPGDDGGQNMFYRYNVIWFLWFTF